MTTLPDVQDLIDRQAITDLLYRYCRAVDRLDVPLGRSIWHDDARADYGDFYRGAGADVIDRICAAHRALTAHSHQVTNVLIDLDGDRAGSESYCIAAARSVADGVEQEMVMWTRYVDRWERRGGRWGLVHRSAIRDFDEVRTVTPMSRDERSRRDRGDPSYAVLLAETAR